MKTLIALTLAVASTAFQEVALGPPLASADYVAFTRIVAEKNLETKKKLVADFEKNLPKSDRLPEAFMDLSRTLITATECVPARQYAQKAVAVVAKMKSDATANPNADRKLQQWLA